jgi:aspartate/methionine/tyrosine aminotransferase
MLSQRLTDAVKLVVLASPNDPTGTVPRKRLEDLAAALAGHSSLVLVDETYWPFIWDDAAYRSPAGDSRLRDRTVLLRSLSDAYGLAAWRVGYLAGPARLLSPILKLKQAISISSTVASQHAALAALRLPEGSPEGPSWLRQVRVDLLWFADELRGLGFMVNRPDGGPWLLVSNDRADLTGRLAARGVVVADGARFGSLSRGWVRVTWADRSMLSRALPLFTAAMEA